MGEFGLSWRMGISVFVPVSVQSSNSFTKTNILTTVGTLTARAIIRNGQLGFPIDLQPLGLNVAERFSKIQGVHAILDTDAYYFGREKFDVDALQSRFRALHDVIGTAFWATVTNRAKEAFRQST